MAPTIAIVGGGPAGLTLARILECKGFDYVVYERYESGSSRPGGGTLDIHEETGQRALKEAKLFDEFCKHARWEDDRTIIYDKHGNSYGDLGGGEPNTSGEGGRPEIDRVALRQILLDSIPKEKIRWNACLKATSIGEDGKPVLEFTDGSHASGFDLVVGADGAFSKVRKMITQARPQYSGRHYIESIIETSSPVHSSMEKTFGRGTMAALAGREQMMIQRQGNSSYRIYFGITVPEDFSRNSIDLSNIEATQHTLATNFFASWDNFFTKYIPKCDNFRSWPLYTMRPEDLSWTSVHGVTLIGDAAHVSVPAGEGVNCAMVDALVLASKIEEHGTSGIDNAVQDFEKDMFLRGKDVISESLGMNELMSHPDGPSVLLQAFQQGQS